MLLRTATHDFRKTGAFLAEAWRQAIYLLGRPLWFDGIILISMFLGAMYVEIGMNRWNSSELLICPYAAGTPQATWSGPAPYPPIGDVRLANPQWFGLSFLPFHAMTAAYLFWRIFQRRASRYHSDEVRITERAWSRLQLSCGIGLFTVVISFLASGVVLIGAEAWGEESAMTGFHLYATDPRFDGVPDHGLWFMVLLLLVFASQAFVIFTCTCAICMSLFRGGDGVWLLGGVMLLCLVDGGAYMVVHYRPMAELWNGVAFREVKNMMPAEVGRELAFRVVEVSLHGVMLACLAKWGMLSTSSRENHDDDGRAE